MITRFYLYDRERKHVPVKTCVGGRSLTEDILSCLPV